MLSKEHVAILKDAVFKDSMGIKQYTTDGVYITGLRIDIEHEFYIQSEYITVTRNRLIIYNEPIRVFKENYL